MSLLHSVIVITFKIFLVNSNFMHKLWCTDTQSSMFHDAFVISSGASGNARSCAVVFRHLNVLSYFLPTKSCTEW